MSHPPMKTPAILRWLSLIVVLVAVVLRFWPHGPSASGNAATPASAPAAASASAAPSGTGAAAGGESSARTFGAGVGFRSHERLAEHFAKHGREFAAASEHDYLRMAQALRDRPAGGDVLEIRRADGVISRFDRASGAFLAFGADGVIRTFFKPNDGERYFERQAAREH